jgi:DNA-binding transcriptional regulator YiaG
VTPPEWIDHDEGVLVRETLSGFEYIPLKELRWMRPLEIKAARLALGMNQREFAEALRVGSEAVIRSWESGRRPISGPASVAIELMLKQTAHDAA